MDSPTEAQRICVHIFGHALNGWEGGDDRTYRAEVQFINVLLVLWQPPNGNVGVIEPGNYCFPFSFIVPQNVSSAVSIIGARQEWSGLCDCLIKPFFHLSFPTSST
ncbi:hypothetical protein AAVH_15054 [Aphelenchoides avenae]|nr:hypothetical protein AAVH_15054 [Aphelenchus avenae]